MVAKKWILVGCFTAMAMLVCAVTYAEKSENEESLPAAVASAVKAAFPKAAIENFSEEQQELTVYEVELENASMIIGKDGTVATIETVEEESKLPAPVAAAIKKQNGKVVKVEKEVKKAELKLVKLGTPVTTYEATITKDGKDIEVAISADGKIIENKDAEKDKD
jgi:uncharacterized protein YuzE